MRGTYWCRRKGAGARLDGWRLGRALLIAIVLGAGGKPHLHGQPETPSESEVKAVYLYNFGKFIQWPVEPGQDAFVICVLGEDPFGPILDRILEGETLDGRPASPRRIADVGQAEGCRIVFISSSEARRLTPILEGLKGSRILTVSDVTDFASRGGMIELVVEGERVRFDVDLNAARAAGLVLSSELLKVARRVRGAESGAS